MDARDRRAQLRLQPDDFAREELDALGEQMEQMFEELKQDEPREEIPSETGQAPPLG